MQQNKRDDYPAASYWERKHFLARQDVIIIGSGFVGMNAAIYLKEKSPLLQVCILDAGLMPLGASTRNAGFACFGTPGELEDDLTHMDEKEVFETVDMRYKGLLRLREKWGDHAMNYKSAGGVELFGKGEHENFERLASKLDFFNTKLEPIVGRPDCIEIKPNSYGLNIYPNVFFNPLEGKLDPGKLVKFLLAKAGKLGIQILFNVCIEQINETAKETILHSTNGLIFSARKCLIATNGFIKRLFPEIAVYPARNQVLITKPLNTEFLDPCFHYNRGYYYFRTVDGRILLGGARNISKAEEVTDRFGQTDIIQKELIRFLETCIIPGKSYEIDQWWSGIMGIGPSKKVIIEWVGNHQLVAVRLGGMGVAIGTHIGESAGQKILESL